MSEQQLSAHDHGNCELCDYIDAKLADLEAEMRRFAEIQTELATRWEARRFVERARDFRQAAEQALAWAERLKGLRCGAGM